MGFFDGGTQIFILGPFFMLDGLDSPILAGSGSDQSGSCHWAHQISGICLFFAILGPPRAQKLIKMCTKMFVFAVANSQNTHYGLKRVFFGISEIGTPPPILKKGGGCLQRIRYVRHLQPRFLAELDR